MNRRADDIQQFFNLIASSMEICKKFCERIPGIGDINPGDRELLYQSASLDLVILRMAYRYDLILMYAQNITS
jgi:nuclear receptor subfamily 4 group A protein 2